jgi:hypothetical protein
MTDLHHNDEVAKRTQYHMFTALIHGLFSTRLSVVIPCQIIKLRLLFGQSGGGRIGRRSRAETPDLTGRVSAALKMILRFHHDAPGALSGEQKAWCGEHLSRSTAGVSPSGSIGARLFGRETIWDVRDAIHRYAYAAHRGARRWPNHHRLRGAARHLRSGMVMKPVLPFFIASSLVSVSGAEAFGPPGTSVAINIMATTQLVSPSGSTQIYVTAWDVLANLTGSISLVYGTTSRTPCDTGTVALTGNYYLVAQSGLSRDGGIQPLYVVPAGNALCAVTSAGSVSFAGSLSYTQY